MQTNFIFEILQKLPLFAVSFGEGVCSNVDRATIITFPAFALQCILESLENLVSGLRNVTIALGLLFIIVGGITLATNQGNPEKIEKGKQTITWAIAAIVLAIIFWSLIVILAQIAGTDYIDPSGVIPVPDPKELFPKY